MLRTSLITNSRGTILPILSVLITISAILSYTMHKSYIDTLKIDNFSRAKTGVERMHALLVSSLKEDAIWNSTINEPSNYRLKECIEGSIICPYLAIGPIELTITDTENELQFGNSSTNNWGFTVDGKPCLSYNGTYGSNRCPFTYKISWQPSCDVSLTCINPRIQITAELEVHQKDRRLVSTLNTEKYRVVLVR